MLEDLKETALGQTGATHSMRTNLFFSVEINPSGLIPIYKFRLRKSSSNDAYILVKEGSAILTFLKTGQEINAKYSTEEQSDSDALIKTKINYNIKEIQGRFKGHLMVGLSPI